MTSSPVESEASWPCCIASWVIWYCSVSVASMTAALAPAFKATSFWRMSTRSCSVATRFFWLAIVRVSMSRSAVFCVRSASNEASAAASWPRSAASTLSSRKRKVRRHVVRPVDLRRWLECSRPRGRQRRLAAERLGAGGGEFSAGGPDVGLGGRGIEFDEDIARLHLGCRWRQEWPRPGRSPAAR